MTFSSPKIQDTGGSFIYVFDWFSKSVSRITCYQPKFLAIENYHFVQGEVIIKWPPGTWMFSPGFKHEFETIEKQKKKCKNFLDCCKLVIYCNTLNFEILNGGARGVRAMLKNQNLCYLHLTSFHNFWQNTPFFLQRPKQKSKIETLYWALFRKVPSV